MSPEEGKTGRRPFGSLPEREGDTRLTALILDIHDGLVQNLFAANAQVYTLQRALEEAADCPPEVLAQGLQRVAALLEEALLEIRAFVRAFAPDDVSRQDLATLLAEVADRRRQLTGMDIRVRVDEAIPPPPLAVRIALYRILQEALANAYRHGAASQVDVQVMREGETLVLDIWDNGRGFDPAQLPAITARGTHLGLRGMRERVHTLGGVFDVESAPGQGTHIRVRVRIYWE